MIQDENPLRLELAELRKQLEDPQVYQYSNYPQLAKRHKELQAIVNLLNQRQNLEKQKVDAEKISLDKDPSLVQLAKTEIEQISDELEELEKRISALLEGPDETDEISDCIIEIRAGVGGAESSLFTGDLYRMYLRYSEKQNWKTDSISQSPSEVGGFKEIIFEVHGQNSYKYLKFESGVHRVQRIPSTESQGRIHTSTASVAVMAKITAQDLEIKAADLRIDTYRSGGHGGQSVNKTDSAVRVTHLPSGMIVTCQDEKSQFKNKEKALDVLRARLLAKQKAEQQETTSSERQKLIGRAFRNEKIRTYNFPQDRLTDHRINFSINNLSSLLNGQLQPLIDKLEAYRHGNPDS